MPVGAATSQRGRGGWRGSSLSHTNTPFKSPAILGVLPLIGSLLLLLAIPTVGVTPLSRAPDESGGGGEAGGAGGSGGGAWFIATPAWMETGGPEALHQLCMQLRALGLGFKF
jgi:hypothetical protein